MRAEGIIKQMGMEIPFKNFHKKPNKFRSEQEFMGQQMIQTYNGVEGWMVMQGQVQPLPEQAVEQLKENPLMLKNPLINYKESGSQVKLLGRETADGVDCYKIEVITKDNETSNVFISANEYFLHKIITNNPQVGEIEILFQNRKVIKGMTFPYEILTKTPMGNGSIEFKTIDFDPELSDSLFEKPVVEK
jgi:outer membrane lipoprotein-sorting protein